MKKWLTRWVYQAVRSYEARLQSQKLQALKHLGSNYRIGNDFTLINPKYISIGNHFQTLDRIRIEAWDFYEGEHFSPTITIGNRVSFNTDIHIGAIQNVTIGDDCLLASRIYITDHAHGEITAEALNKVPAKRPLVSKGPVVIESGVWIGEGVVILPNVTIGANAIIGANAVVTKNVPARAVVAGVPAKVIHQF
jgi:acetyltransferase-like isoleucine patch superfamily enzyme